MRRRKYEQRWELDVSPDEAAGEVRALMQVEERLKRGISNIKGKRDWFKRGSQLQTVALSLLSGATTLLIALNQIYHQSVLVALSLVAGALTTVTVAWTGWFGFHRLWLANAATLVKLWALRDRIEYDKALYGDRLTRDQVNGYFEKYQQIFAEHDQGKYSEIV
jgi:hypothetical protein